MNFNEEHALETYRSLIGLGKEALKALQLLNGGAIVALLAYLGHGPGQPCFAYRAACPMGIFVAGLVLGTVAFLTTYFTQFALFNESVNQHLIPGGAHTRWLYVTVLVGLLSLIAFAWGAFASLAVLGKPC